MPLGRAPRSSYRGTAQMAVGLAISGLGTMVMIGLASRSSAPQDFAAFVTWWLTVSTLAPLLGAFEVYLARCLLAGEIGTSANATRGVISQLLGLALLAVGVVAGVVLLVIEPLADGVFGGDVWAPATIPLYLLVVAVQSIQRGVAAGRRRFGVIGLQLTADGVLRVLLAVVAVSLGGTPWAYFAPVLAGLGSVAVASIRLRSWIFPPHPRARTVEARPVVWLMMASAGPVLISSAVAPWLAAASSDAVVVGAFSAALTLSRIPTQLASAAFSPALAHLAAAVDRADEPAFRRIRRSLLAVAGGAGCAFLGLFVALGNAMLAVFVGAAYSLPAWVFGALAATSLGLFLATVQQAALTAVRRWSGIAWAWTVGCLAFAGMLQLPIPALARASTSSMVGVLVTVILMEVATVRWGRTGRVASPAHYAVDPLPSREP